MARRVTRSSVERLEQRLARLSRAQAPGPEGPGCTLCGHVPDSGAPAWTPAGCPVVEAPGGVRLCALRCTAPADLAYRLAAHATGPGAPADAEVVARATRAMVGLARADGRWTTLWNAVANACDALERQASDARLRRDEDGGPDLPMAAVLEAWVEMLIETLAGLLEQAQTDPDGAAAAVGLDALVALERAPADVQGPARGRAQALQEALLQAAAERLQQGGLLPDPAAGWTAWAQALDRARDALQAVMAEGVPLPGQAPPDD